MGDLTRSTIKLLEGRRLTAYKDAGGHSIGYGHFIKPEEKDLLTREITDEEAEKLLSKDIESHQSGINEWLRRPMSEQKKAALTSLAYNTGAKSDAVKRVVDLYNKGKDKEAAEAFAAYNKSYNPKTGVKETNDVLVKRREFEKRLFMAEGKADIASLHKEVFGQPGKKPLAVASSRSLTRFGSKDVAMNENKSIFSQLQQLNQEFEQNADANSAFLRRIRREGRGGMS